MQSKFWSLLQYLWKPFRPSIWLILRSSSQKTCCPFNTISQPPCNLNFYVFLVVVALSYLSAISRWAKNNDNRMEQSVPYTPQQNGVADRKNISLNEMGTCILHDKHLNPYLWDEGVKCASYSQNRVSHKSVVATTPFEELHGNKPNVSHLKVFGSKYWAIIPLNKREYFQTQSSECILLGYAEDAKYYKLMEVATIRWFIERSVQFEEDQLYDTPPVAHEGITIFSPIFYDDDVLQVSNSDEEDHSQHDPITETESQEILDLDPVSIPNHKPNPIWGGKLLDDVGSGARNLEDKRRTRSQCHNEHVALSLTYSLHT